MPHLEVLSQKPTGPARPTPVLFVHGAWHAAWCWENFLPYFAQRGYEAHALSLRGHGHSAGREAIRWHSAARGYVADVAQVAQALRTPPVVIGHSMGGYVVQKYLEQYSAPLGVLLASIPVTGLVGFAMRYATRHPRHFLLANLQLDPRVLINTPELVHEALFSARVPRAEVMRHYERLQSESVLMQWETLVLALPRPARVKTPMLVMAAEQDQLFTVDEARLTARAYHAQIEIFPNMAHNLMLEPGWENVAERILEWLEDHNL